MLHVPAEIQAEIDRGALFVFNHSGGKDSQAMTILVRQIVPADQIVVIHAHLAGVEWAGTADHARYSSPGLEFRQVAAGKTFMEMVERRGMFPGIKHRQCTSDLKRDPINTLIRRIAKERGISRIVNCMGLRAEESISRRRQPVVKLNKRLSVAGRHCLDWLPIHGLTVRQVFAVIALAGQVAHWAYAKGMTRLSCCFCIMSSLGDLRTAAMLNPLLAARYIGLEYDMGHTLQQGRSLDLVLAAA